MPRIGDKQAYKVVSPSLDDRAIGTDASDTSTHEDGETVQFEWRGVLGLFQQEGHFPSQSITVVDDDDHYAGETVEEILAEIALQLQSGGATHYMPSPRGNTTRGVPPTTSETSSASINGDTARILLSDGTAENWVRVSSAWVLRSTEEPNAVAAAGPRHYTPAARANSIKGVAPTTAETAATPAEGSTARIILSDGAAESWIYDTGAWVLRVTEAASPFDVKHYCPAQRSDSVRGVAPTSGETSAALVEGDTARIVLLDGTGENWVYLSSAWVARSTEEPRNDQSYVSKTTGQAIDANKLNVYPAGAVADTSGSAPAGATASVWIGGASGAVSGYRELGGLWVGAGNPANQPYVTKADGAAIDAYRLNVYPAGATPDVSGTAPAGATAIVWVGDAGGTMTPYREHGGSWVTSA